MTALVIGMGGKLRAGKDAVADRLVEVHGFKKLGMSDVLNEAMLLIDPIVHPTGHIVGTVQPLRYSEIVERYGYVEAKTRPEVRRLLQKLGTEVGRNMLGENVWVNALARKIDDHLYADQSVVVTGIRFPNELAMIRQFAGEGLWVDRPGLDSDSPASTHASENGVSAEDFDRIITNDGTLEQLYATVDAFMERKRT